ncbi:MAG: hypothetical protein HOI95_15850 [Chromatiales bacterium]|nr:hypothetical protein [Chromatiales bacterium]
MTFAQATARGIAVLCQGATVRRHLLASFADDARCGGKSAWQRPHIETLDAWLARQFERLIDDGHERRVLLNGHQTTVLWESVIREWAVDSPLLRTRDAARNALRTDADMRQWRVSADAVRLSGTAEALAFLDWQSKVRGRCQEAGWITRPRVLDRILRGIRERHVQTTPQLAILMPTPMPPAWAELLRSLIEAGCDVRRLELPGFEPMLRRVEAPDIPIQMQWVARWAVGALEANPYARLALVSPRMRDHEEALRSQLERCFEEQWPGRYPLDERPYSTIVTTALADAPAIDAALLLLDCISRPVPVQQLSALLRNPFLPDAQSEAAGRAELDVRLRRTGRVQATVRTLIALSESGTQAGSRCPQLLAHLESLVRLCSAQVARQPLSAWAQFFSRALNTARWPGDGPNTASLRRSRLRFQELLPALGQLGPLVGICNLSSAIRLLRDLARETTFYSSSSDGRVQLLDMETAAALNFDAMWLMGVDDAAWPPPSSSRGFLTPAVASLAGIPNASPAGALHHAQMLNDKLLGCAPDIVISHVLGDAELSFRVSPLLQRVPVVPISAVPLIAMRDQWQVALGCAVIEAVDDAHGPRLQSGGPAPGGTAFVAAQAACPFQAFALYRLGLRPLEAPATGVDPRISGDLVHETLRAVWAELSTSASLHAEADLLGMARRAFKSAAKVLARRAPHLLESRLAVVEEQRVVRLVARWLEFERDRRTAPFSVVAMERTDVVQVGPLQLVVRADRVDSVEDGLIVIDYKTGRGVSARGWDEPRMQQPQVPLYALTNSAKVAGAALAQVRLDEMGFRGVARASDVFPRVTGDDEAVAGAWAQRLGGWQEHLECLAEEAERGVATVTPATSSACLYCPLPGACRIDEHRLLREDDESEDADSDHRLGLDSVLDL